LAINVEFELMTPPAQQGQPRSANKSRKADMGLLGVRLAEIDRTFERSAGHQNAIGVRDFCDQ